MSFVQNNWMLIAVFVLSGGMLIWPFVQRRLSLVKDVTSAEATQLLNRRNAVLLGNFLSTFGPSHVFAST